MVMDAASRDDLPDYVDSNRLPRWLFPHTATDTNPHLQFRPDILFIPSIKLADAKAPDFTTTPSTHTVHILEVGYAADTNHASKQHEKAQQHQRLADELRTAGWKVVYTPQTASAWASPAPSAATSYPSSSTWASPPPRPAMLRPPPRPYMPSPP